MISIRQSVTRSILRSTFSLENRTFATSALRRNTATTATPQQSSIDPKITSIVDQISKLTLLETSSLISELKTTLNIPDIAFPTGGAAGAAPAQAAPAEEVVEEAVEEKTIFNLKLESFDAKSKPKIIKEVKSLLGLSLVESKKFVESAPKVLKENVTKEDGEKIKSTLEALGAKITLE